MCVLYMMTTSNGKPFRVTDPCGGNPSFIDGFPSQRQVTPSFDVFLDLRLNKWLSKQSGRPWFETPSRSLWRYCHWSAFLMLVYHQLQLEFEFENWIFTKYGDAIINGMIKTYVRYIVLVLATLRDYIKHTQATVAYFHIKRLKFVYS